MYYFGVSEPFIIEGINENPVIAQRECLRINYSSHNTGSSEREVRFRIIDANPSPAEVFKYRLRNRSLDQLASNDQ